VTGNKLCYSSTQVLAMLQSVVSFFQVYNLFGHFIVCQCMNASAFSLRVGLHHYSCKWMVSMVLALSQYMFL